MKNNIFKKVLTWSFPYANKDIPEYGNKEKVAFALGMFGQNLIYTIVGSFLSIFYTDVILVPALALLIITIISRIWDAINDLMMGSIVDKTKSAWGKCRPYLKYAPIPIALFTVLLFAPVKELANPAKIIFVIITWLTWELLYTLGDIPLWGMTSLMTDNVEQRTKLVSLARIIGGASIVLTFVFKPLVSFFGGLNIGLFQDSVSDAGVFFSEQQGYFLTVLALTVVGSIFFKIPFIYTRERVVPEKANEDSLSFKDGLKLFVSNKYFVRTMLSQILGSARGISMSMAVYLSAWVFANGGNDSLWYIFLMVPFILGNFVTMLLANKYDKRFDKINVMKVMSLVSIAFYVVMFLSFKLLGLSIASLVIICICLFVAGTSSGFPAVYYTTMIQDAIDYKEYESGKRYDGVYLSGLNFISKFNNAVTLGITYLAFYFVNYTPRIDAIKASLQAGATINFMSDFPDLAWVLIGLSTVVPALACLLQTIPLFGYKLDNKTHDGMVRELIERRKKHSEEK